MISICRLVTCRISTRKSTAADQLTQAKAIISAGDNMAADESVQEQPHSKITFQMCRTVPYSINGEQNFAPKKSKSP